MLRQLPSTEAKSKTKKTGLKTRNSGTLLSFGFSKRNKRKWSAITFLEVPMRSRVRSCRANPQPPFFAHAFGALKQVLHLSGDVSAGRIVFRKSIAAKQEKEKTPFLFLTLKRCHMDFFLRRSNITSCCATKIGTKACFFRLCRSTLPWATAPL